MIVDGSATPPSGLGSGKPVTPCERMQSANAIPCPVSTDPIVVLDMLEDPQAAITTAQLTAASALGARTRWPFRVWAVFSTADVTAASATDMRQQVRPVVARCGRSTNAGLVEGS